MKGADIGTTEKLAKFVVETGYDDFPKETVEWAKALVLSFLGAAIGGSVTPTGKMVINHIKEMGGTPDTGIIGGGFKSSLVNAAFVHGITPHTLEVEDDSFPGSSSPMTILPVVLALGEKFRLSGKKLIEGFILGFEVEGKIGRGVPRSEAIGAGSMTMWGALGSAAGGAKLLGLDLAQTKVALSLAASQAGGLAIQLGYQAHFFESGIASRNGMVAALLARDGLTAHPDVLESPRGLFGAYFNEDEYDLDQMVKDLGNPFHIHLIHLKMYPCCYLNHRTIEGLLDLINEYKISADQVEVVEVETSPVVPTVLQHHDPQSTDEARFSLEFNVAVTLLDKKISQATFIDDKVRNPRIKEMMRRVKIVVHPEWEAVPMQGSEIVTVRLKDGRELTKEVKYQKGHPKNPPTNDEVVGKFKDCAGLAMANEEMAKVQELVLAMDKLSDISELMDLAVFRTKA